MRLFRGSAAPPGKGTGGGGGGANFGGRLAVRGGQRGFSPPSPPRHSSCCAGSGGGLHPRPQSSAGCAGALSAYSLKWEIRALRNGGCAAGAQARVCPCALSRSSPRRLARPGVPGSPSAERRPGASPGPAAAATCSLAGQAGSASRHAPRSPRFRRVGSGCELW